MTHKRGISTALIVLLGFGFLTNSVTTSQAADQDTNFNVSKSLVENTIKFKEDQIKEEKENKLADIKFEEKKLNQENTNSELDN